MNHDRYRAILAGETSPVIRQLLGACTPAYRSAVALRNQMFDQGLRRPASLGRPTVSVGNLTTGGTGKTPMVAAVCHHLLEQGKTPAVLLRGYHADSQGQSDEAQQLRSELPDAVIVMPNPSRIAGAKAVLKEHPHVDVFVLDDGFQHRQAARDVDLVLVDATQPFGFGRLLPRGLLREPMTSLARADAIVVTRADQISSSQLHHLDQTIARYHRRPPIAHAAHRWQGWRVGEEQKNLDAASTLRVAAITGIGNPKAFEHTLREHVTQIVWHRRLDDHHPYSQAELEQAFAQAQHDGAQALVTTEKDWVKWAPLLADRPGLIPVWRPWLGLDLFHGRQAWQALLDPVIQSSIPAG